MVLIYMVKPTGRGSGGQTNKLFVDGDAFFSGAVDCGNKENTNANLAIKAMASPKPFDLVKQNMHYSTSWWFIC